MPEIRTAAPADIPGLCALMERYYAHDQLEFDGARVTEALGTLLRAARGMAWLIGQDRAEIGYAVIVWSYSLEYGGIEAVLDELYLEPEARGAGFGRAVMEHVIREAKNAGAVVLRLETEPENSAARAFYAKLGFEALNRQIMKLEW